MPFLQILTNTAVSDADQETLLTEAAQLVSEALGKDPKYFMAHLQPGQTMRFGGSDAPLAFLSLKALGLPAEQTTSLSDALCTLVTNTLAIPTDRIYLEFADVERGMWGWNRTVF